jgi:uncharacterized repeat protein (TIGR01451 family)
MNTRVANRCFFLVVLLLAAALPWSASAQTFTNSTPGAINDNQCINRTIVVPAGLFIADLNVPVDITHTYRGDLDITLTSPAGTDVVLTSDNGGGANNLRVVFDDSATQSIVGDNATHNATVQRRPEELLSTFNGQDAGGTWNLEICDDAFLDTGTFNVYSLVFVAAPRLSIAKALPLGRFAATDQFTLTVNGPGGPVSTTTTGSGTTASGSAVRNPATAGGAYTVSETGAGTPVANLSNYAVTYACTNALAGGQTPSGSGSSFNVTPVAGDNLTCTFTNTRNPSANLSITKTNTPGVNGEVDQSGDTVVSGSNSVYTITVTNNGPDAANGAVIRDPAAPGLSCLSVTCDGLSGAACPGGAINAAGVVVPLASFQGGVPIPTLPNGGRARFTLTCLVL